jgi:hypothetical protein
LADLLLVRDVQLPRSGFHVDAEIELTERSPDAAGPEAGGPSIEEMCAELVRLGFAESLTTVQTAASVLASGLLAAFPEIRRASVTVWSPSPGIEGAAVDAIGATATRERSAPSPRQGRSITRPRPRP